MEDVLEVYHRPQDPDRPLVCLDESTKQLVQEVRPALGPRPGQSARYDSEYVRHGVSSYFMLLAPLEGWREVLVTGTKTQLDYAHTLKFLSDEAFAKAQKIVLVQDNLNTHSPASLYQAFGPKEARRLTERFEFHYTPKHGSWLNMAEIELSVLQRQCLDQRIPTAEDLTQKIDYWKHLRNQTAKSYSWHFSLEDARVKLKTLYPEADG